MQLVISVDETPIVEPMIDVKFAFLTILASQSNLLQILLITRSIKITNVFSLYLIIIIIIIIIKL